MPKTTVQASWTDPFASPMELAIWSAQDLEQEWEGQITDGIGDLLSNFERVPLTDAAAHNLATTRRLLEEAHESAKALADEFLAANPNPNHNTEA